MRAVFGLSLAAAARAAFQSFGAGTCQQLIGRGCAPAARGALAPRCAALPLTPPPFSRARARAAE